MAQVNKIRDDLCSACLQVPGRAVNIAVELAPGQLCQFCFGCKNFHTVSAFICHCWTQPASVTRHSSAQSGLVEEQRQNNAGGARITALESRSFPLPGSSCCTEALVWEIKEILLLDACWEHVALLKISLEVSRLACRHQKGTVCQGLTCSDVSTDQSHRKAEKPRFKREFEL